MHPIYEIYNFIKYRHENIISFIITIIIVGGIIYGFLVIMNKMEMSLASIPISENWTQINGTVALK